MWLPINSYDEVVGIFLNMPSDLFSFPLLLLLGRLHLQSNRNQASAKVFFRGRWSAEKANRRTKPTENANFRVPIAVDAP